MAFDDTKQFGYTLPGGGRGEHGYQEFSEGSTTLDVATHLITTNSWNVTIAADPSSSARNSYTYDVRTDGDITTGAVTFTRETMRLDVSQGFYYDIRGW